MLLNSASVMLYFICFAISLSFAGVYDLVKIKVVEKSHFKTLQYFLLFFSGLPLVLLGCFRVNTGIDQSLYAEEYYSIGAGGWAHSDKGFQILNLFLYKLGFSDVAMFAVCNILLIVGLILLVKSLNISVSLSVFLFLFSFHYFNSYSLIAQYTAIAFLCFALRNMIFGHKISGILFIAVAFFMHSSAAIFIPILLLYYIFKRFNNKNIFFAILASFIVIGISIKPLILLLLQNTRFNYYLVNNHYADIHSGSMILISIVSLIFMSLLLPEVFREQHNQLLLTLYATQFLFVILSLVQNQVTLLFRLLYYLWFFSIIAIPKYVQLIHNNRTRAYVVVMICMLYICWFVYFPLQNNYYYILPYQFR